MAPARIGDDPVLHAVDRVTGRRYGILKHRQFRRRNFVARIVLERPLGPYAARLQARPVVCRRDPATIPEKSSG